MSDWKSVKAKRLLAALENWLASQTADGIA